MAPSKIIKSFALVFLAALWAAPNILFAQEGEEEEGAKEQIRSRMNLSCEQKNDDAMGLHALVRAKIEGQYTGLPGLEVEFFTATDSSETSLGKATTDEKGIATLTVDGKKIPRDTAGRLAFIAQFEGNDEFGGSDGDISIPPARLVLEPLEEDSSLAIQVTLLAGDEPVAEEDVSLFVKRFFRPLKVGEGTTDEEGMLTLDFPMHMPGDPQGNLEIYALLEEHDDFSSVKASMTKAWGTPVSDRLEDMPRTLWSPNPPLWMVLTFIVLMVVVWGHYAVIIYKLVQVKKEGEAG